MSSQMGRLRWEKKRRLMGLWRLGLQKCEGLSRKTPPVVTSRIFAGMTPISTRNHDSAERVLSPTRLRHACM